MLQGAMRTIGFPEKNSQENIEEQQVSEEEKKGNEDFQRISKDITAASFHAQGSVETSG